MPDPIAKHLEVLADALATPGEGTLCPHLGGPDCCYTTGGEGPCWDEDDDEQRDRLEE